MCSSDLVHREILIGAPSTQWWIQLSTSIVFGLTFATILTLIVTPAQLAFFARLRQLWDRIRRKKPAPPGSGIPVSHQPGPAE